MLKPKDTSGAIDFKDKAVTTGNKLQSNICESTKISGKCPAPNVFASDLTWFQSTDLRRINTRSRFQTDRCDFFDEFVIVHQCVMLHGAQMNAIWTGRHLLTSAAALDRYCGDMTSAWPSDRVGMII